jgi:hypothetical protein
VRDGNRNKDHSFPVEVCHRGKLLGVIQVVVAGARNHLGEPRCAAGKLEDSGCIGIGPKLVQGFCRDPILDAILEEITDTRHTASSSLSHYEYLPQ